MAVRNFWIAADIDGRKTELHGGPVRKDGGFTLHVYVRDEGRIMPGLRVEGIAHEDGRLELVTFPMNVSNTDPITLATTR